jgi:hypothetical protein
MAAERLKRTTRMSLWNLLVWRRAVVLTALLVLFLSSVTWLWDEVIGTARPRIVDLIARLHWYGFVIAGLVVMIYLLGDAAYHAIHEAEVDLEAANTVIHKHHDGRAIPMLEIVNQPAKQAGSAGPIFKLHNCGDRVARFVRVQPIHSTLEKFTLHFEELPLLHPGKSQAIAYWVSESKLSNDQALRAFLNNHTEDAALIWFDTPIKFRDTDESVSEHNVRICFDVEADVLYVAAVPWTQNPPLKREPIRQPS